ncbi:MAG: PAS domain S-box protein [Dehalococcoidales bacterium]|nr:PAS domain S-box protein [Dehalococcoidales bacterium]
MAQSLLSSEMLANIIDGSSIPSFVINKQHRVTHWNTAIEALSGIEREEVIGTDKQWRAFYTEKRPVMADLIVDGAHVNEIKAYYPSRYKKSHLIDGAYEAEDFFLDLGKNGKWLHFTASPIRDNKEEIIGAIETLEDITERKRAEEALHESEKSFRALFEGAYDAIWVHDLEGNIQTANKAAAELSGYPLEELLMMNVKSFLGDESLNLAREVGRRLTQHRYVDTPSELRLIRKDGSEAICMVSTNLITSDGEPEGFQNIARDVTQEKRMQENLRYYLQEITKAQEEERKRIARELHDDTAQVLGSLSRQLDNFVRKRHGLAPNEVLFLKDLQAQLNRGVQSVHRFVQDLRPSLLDDLGLIPALRSLVKDLQEYEGIGTSLKVVGGEKRFSPEFESLLFRIVQEALSNIRRHAQASEAQVVIEFAGDKVRVTISDNGRGFELSGGVDDLPRSGKLGLAGMQERARLLGGTFEVKSTPDKGTTLIVEIPR